MYDLILTRISGIDDLRLSIDAGNFEMADRLAQEYSDYLLLILNDLDWGAEGEAVELRMAAGDLRRVFGLFHQRAARSLVIEQEEEAETRMVREGSQLVLDACKQVFTTLDVQAMGT